MLDIMFDIPSMEGDKRVQVTRLIVEGTAQALGGSPGEERMNLLDSLKPRESVELPLVYVRDMVVFPYALAPLFAATRFSVGAVDAALAADKRIFVSLLKDVFDEKTKDIRVQEFGTVARVLQQVRLPDGSSRLAR